MKKVLYIDGVGPFGGSSRSLFEMVQILKDDSVEPYFVVARGTAQEFYAKVAKDIIATRGLSRFDNTRYSHYRGIRWLVLLRELFHFPFTVAALFEARQRWKEVDLIHVNEITEIIPGLIAKWFFKAPLVIHVRSLQKLDSSLRTRWMNSLLKQHASAVVAIDENVRATLPIDMVVDVIQNSFTAKRSQNSDESLLAKLKSLSPSSLKVGFVGNLHYSKGLFDLLNAARLIDQSKHDVEFVIVGGTTNTDKGLKAWLLAQVGLAQDVGAALREKIRDYGLEDKFHLFGPTRDIQAVYERLDVICFPSHFDAPGRPVFEAAFSAVPSIVAVNNPRPDTLVNGETGIAIPAQAPQKLAEAILYFANQPAELKRMGRNAKCLAEMNFHPAQNAKRLVAVYSRVAASNR